jgi:hypothetical protein
MEMIPNRMKYAARALMHETHRKDPSLPTIKMMIDLLMLYYLLTEEEWGPRGYPKQ